jgi:hypothetical protein
MCLCILTLRRRSDYALWIVRGLGKPSVAVPLHPHAFNWADIYISYFFSTNKTVFISQKHKTQSSSINGRLWKMASVCQTLKMILRMRCQHLQKVRPRTPCNQAKNTT